MNNPTKYQFIDSLRGIAILMVIFVHIRLLVSDAPFWLNWLMLKGSNGVQLFYIASALTLYLSWRVRSKQEANPITNFYIRRLFRIAPMFWLAIAVYFSIYGSGAEARYWSPGVSLEWFHVVLTVLFLHGWHPEAITAVVPGGWSVAVEMSFYLVFPLLFTMTRTWKQLLFLFFFSVLGAVSGKIILSGLLQFPPEKLYLAREYPVLWLFGQLPCFIIGFMAAVALVSNVLPTVLNGKVVLFSVITAAAVITALSILFPSIKAIRYLSMYLVTSVIMGFFVLGLARAPIKIFSNRLLATLGKVSFSMYLTHFLAISIIRKTGILGFLESPLSRVTLAFLSVTALAFVVSLITYRLIEVPGIRIGKKIIEFLEERSAKVLTSA